MPIGLEPVVGRQRPGPGFWSHATLDGRPTVTVGCPKCSFVASLGRTHSVADDGVVTPSLECPKCKFHDVVKLIGYPGRAAQPEKGQEV